MPTWHCQDRVSGLYIAGDFIQKKKLFVEGRRHLSSPDSFESNSSVISDNIDSPQMQDSSVVKRGGGWGFEPKYGLVLRLPFGLL